MGQDRMTQRESASGPVWKRTFRYMPTLDGYVLREFMIPFTVLLFAFCLLFMIGDIFNDLSDFMDANVGVSEIIRFFLLKMPQNVRFILPITVLLSCMYTLANFGRHREITAMRASGISLVRCSLPIFVMAFLVMLVNFWFNERLIPECSKEAEIIQESLRNPNYREMINAQLQYQSPDKMRSWFFGLFDRNDEHHDVKLKIFKMTPDGTRKLQDRLIEAKTAQYEQGTGWNFHDATVTLYTTDGLPSETRQYSGADTFTMTSDELPDVPYLIEKSVILPEFLPTWEIRVLLANNPNMASSLRNIYSTLFYYRLAFPWACFFCAFLALPLAAKNERSGIFSAILIAVVVIVSYHVLSEIMLLTGKQGYLPPVVAGLFPTVIFAAYGLYLTKKTG